jgi:hypothetical protein
MTQHHKKETFAAARSRIFAELTALGWKIQQRNAYSFKPLKVPYATAQNGERVWFKPQSLYALGNDLNSSNSICSDYRGVRGLAIDDKITGANK